MRKKENGSPDRRNVVCPDPDFSDPAFGGRFFDGTGRIKGKLRQCPLRKRR